MSRNKIAYLPIEELKSQLLHKRETFRNLIIEQEFYRILLNAPIYKYQYLNLYETLERFKNEIENTIQQTKLVLNEIGMQLFQIEKELENHKQYYQKLTPKKIVDLEHDIYGCLITVSKLKFELFQYLEQVIIDN